MKLIVGLGNPGEKYKKTRHNAGYIMLEALSQMWDFSSFSEDSRFRAFLSTGTLSQEKILLAKPTTFINLSGESVHAIANYYDLTHEDIFLLHDDKDFALGEIRVATQSSSAGHNGVQNIFDHLKTNNIKRVRIGIGPKPEEIPTDAYVLSRFSPEEEKQILELKDDVLEFLQKEFI